jgi:hypothetical protein
MALEFSSENPVGFCNSYTKHDANHCLYLIYVKIYAIPVIVGNKTGTRHNLVKCSIVKKL